MTRRDRLFAYSLLGLVLLAVVALCAGCGAAPEPAAEASSAFTCDRSTVVSNGHGGWVSICLHYAPSRLAGGGPCGADQLEFPVPVGSVAVYTQPSYGGYCMVLGPGYYYNMGDWQSGQYQILSMRTGPRAYAFWFSGLNLVGFTGLDVPNSLEPSPGWSVSSLELLLGQ